MSAFTCLTCFFLALVAVAPSNYGQDQAKPDREHNAVQVEMRNVMYHYTGNVAVHIRNLHGELVPVGNNEVPVFDDKGSFRLKIDAAEIAISPDAMANVLNSYVLARRDSPIKNVSITIESDKLKIKGKLHNKGDIPFETQSTISATSEGKIRLHTEKVKALHLPVKGVMDLFGIDMADLIKNGKIQGIQSEKDDLILDPQQILPQPRIEGKVSSVKLQNNSIVQLFGEPGKTGARPPVNGNFMAYKGNRLRFGKLLMTDTDMILIDMDPKDPFDFYLDRYKEQLVAGYTKTTPAFGLRVYMRDLNKLQPGKSKR